MSEQEQEQEWDVGEWVNRIRVLADSACQLIEARPRGITAVVIVVVPADTGQHDLVLSDGEHPTATRGG